MPLTDATIRAAKSQEGRTIKLSDGGGLQLWVTPSGSKLWNIAYRFGGKQLKLDDNTEHQTLRVDQRVNYAALFCRRRSW